MNRLVNALEELFAAAARSGGDLAQTADFTLNTVNWKDDLNRPDPAGNSVLDMHLAAACANSGQDGSSSHMVAEALLALSNRLEWHMRARTSEDASELEAFSRNFTATTVIGEGGVVPSSKVLAGLSLQAPHTHYPPHAHHAEESYWIIGGAGDWKVGRATWFSVQWGDAIYHQSGAVHAMRTSKLPMLAVWLWTSHLESDVGMVKS